jgi:hypothetical protein
MTWLELTSQVLKKFLASARSTFQTGFLSPKGRQNPRGDALYALLRRNTLQAKLVGKTHPISVLIAMLDYLSPLVSKYFTQCCIMKNDSYVLYISIVSFEVPYCAKNVIFLCIIM